MKRFTMIAILTLLAALAVVSVVAAQAPGPQTPPQAPWQGRGMMGGMMGRGTGEYGPMHEYMQAAIAEKLDLTVEELEQLHDEGQTFWQIAEAQGLNADEARALMLAARSDALDKMVADGTLTQEQADWMKNRSGRMMGGGAGCPGMGGASGYGRNMMGQGRTW